MIESIQLPGTSRPKRYTKRRAILVALTLAIVFAAVSIFLTSGQPRSDRQWIPQQAVMARADVRGDSVFLERVRNFSYTSEEEFTPAYDDRRYDLNKLETVWFIVTPFSKQWRGPAHTFVSFGFADSQYVGISVEARREPGETYGPITGLFRQFELIYVIGDERDLIGSRAVYGGYDVYVYPIRASRERIRSLFLEMLARSNALATQPRVLQHADEQLHEQRGRSREPHRAARGTARHQDDRSPATPTKSRTASASSTTRSRSMKRVVASA